VSSDKHPANRAHAPRSDQLAGVSAGFPGTSRALAPRHLGRLALTLFTALVCLFMVAPSLIVIPMSLNPSEVLTFPPSGYSLRWYANFFERPDWRLAGRNSFVIAVLTTLVATGVGAMTALGLVRGRVPFRALVTAIFLTPMIVPAIVTAVAVYGLYATLRLTGTILGVVLAHAVLALPFVIVNVSAVLQGMDWRVEQAARSLGATPSRAFWLVTLPLIRPGIAAGAVFAFVTSFDELVVALFISGIEAVTLPVQMWSGIRFEINPTVAAVSTMLIAMSAAAFGLVGVLRARARWRGPGL
jgi:putative spermidine/putrescine transport system permease protein